jgi:hypothetical protein
VGYLDNNDIWLKEGLVSKAHDRRQAVPSVFCFERLPSTAVLLSHTCNGTLRYRIGKTSLIMRDTFPIRSIDDATNKLLRDTTAARHRH